MIMGKAIPTTPRWLRIALAVSAVCVLPLGLVYCGPEQAVAPEEAAALKQAPAPPPPVQAIGVTDENGETYLTEVDPPLPPVKSERALEELQATQRLFERARSEQISGGLVRKRIGSQSELPPELQAESERVRAAIASGDMSKQEAEVVLRRLEATIAETRAQDGTQIRELSATPQRPGTQAQVGPAFLKEQATDPPGPPLDVTELTPEALAALQEAKAQVSRDIEAGSLSPEEGRALLEKVLRQLKSGG